MSILPVFPEVPVRQLAVIRGEEFRVAHGVNEGDGLTEARDLVHADIYMPRSGASPERLALAPAGTPGRFTIAPGSALGRPGAPVFLDSLLTFMDRAGNTTEGLVFVEIEPESACVAEVYLFPLAPLPEKTGQSLVTIDTNLARAEARLAACASVAFTRGTHITMADGRQVPIEALREGDRVLTRDSGPQQVRWIGMQTVRAHGPLAPIRIRAGALNNSRDLVVSPNHRLFVYQRVDAVGAGRRELLVKAGLLVNGVTVTQEPGGFVDYFQILFDKHEIIYAEGIAAESLFVDTATRPAVPEAVARHLQASGSEAGLRARELRPGDIAARPDTVDLLRRASAI